MLFIPAGTKKAIDKTVAEITMHKTTFNEGCCYCVNPKHILDNGTICRAGKTPEEKERDCLSVLPRTNFQPT